MSQLLDDRLNSCPIAPLGATRAFYLRCMALLDEERIPYLVGGGYATAYYTGIARQTKDLDLFIRPADRDRALGALSRGGYRVEITWPHFLAKATEGEAFVDLIYRSGNGLCEVDDGWFAHAIPAEVLAYPVRLAPAEETIWSKAFVQERDRYDGADIAHLILSRGRRMDWGRLIRRFGEHYRVLLAHLILFGFVYPSERDVVPDWVMDGLTGRLREELPEEDRICQGTLLAKHGYLPDVQTMGFADVRRAPHGEMCDHDIAHFTRT